MRVQPIYPPHVLHSLYKLSGIEMRSWSEFSREIRHVFWSREFKIFIKTKTCLIFHYAACFSPMTRSDHRILKCTGEHLITLMGKTDYYDFEIFSSYLMFINLVASLETQQSFSGLGPDRQVSETSFVRQL